MDKELTCQIVSLKGVEYVRKEANGPFRQCTEVNICEAQGNSSLQMEQYGSAMYVIKEAVGSPCLYIIILELGLLVTMIGYLLPRSDNFG